MYAFNQLLPSLVDKSQSFTSSVLNVTLSENKTGLFMKKDVSVWLTHSCL